MMRCSSTRRRVLATSCVGLAGLIAGCAGFGESSDTIQLAVVNDDDTTHEVRLRLETDSGGVFDERLTVAAGERVAVEPYDLGDPLFESTAELFVATEAHAGRELEFGVGGDSNSRSVLVRVTTGGEIDFEWNGV